MVPGLARPEPLPAGASDESSDDDHRDPQDDEAEEERGDGKLALLPGVVAAAQRISVDIWNRHQADDDERGHNYAGNPGIEVDEHFLQAQEVPRRFGRIHGQVGIGRLFKGRAQRDGPDHQDNGDDNGGKEFNAQQEGPDVDFLLPARTEGPGFAMMRFGERRTGLQFGDERVVGLCLLPCEINVEGEQGD